ncbi:MAG: hypothetical protein RSD19_04220, partial [Oscillospiraceae bacterium]
WFYLSCRVRRDFCVMAECEIVYPNRAELCKYAAKSEVVTENSPQISWKSAHSAELLWSVDTIIVGYFKKSNRRAWQFVAIGCKPPSKCAKMTKYSVVNIMCVDKSDGIA